MKQSCNMTVVFYKFKALFDFKFLPNCGKSSNPEKTQLLSTNTRKGEIFSTVVDSSYSVNYSSNCHKDKRKSYLKGLSESTMNIDFSTWDSFCKTVEVEHLLEVRDVDFRLVNKDGRTPLRESFFDNIQNSFYSIDDNIVEKIKEAALNTPSKVINDHMEKLFRSPFGSLEEMMDLYNRLTGGLLVGDNENYEDPWGGILPDGVTMTVKIDAMNKVVMITEITFTIIP